MSGPASQFYGVEVSDYNIRPIKKKAPEATDALTININNAHLYAFAYQHGYQAPSLQRIAKTVNKNGLELTINRLDRAFRNCEYNIYKTIFKKNRQTKAIPKQPTQAKRKEAFQVQSPEQIVIKSARQAYSRQVLAKINEIKPEVRLPSQAQVKRKQHQKQRRLQRTLILKAYKHELFAIFGKIIYTRGWKIGRQQLKANLALPPGNYQIDFMKDILVRRQLKAALDRQIFLLKRKQYQRQKYERFKILQYMRRFHRNTYVPHSQIEYPHKEVAVYEKKRHSLTKSKERKSQGERIKRLKKRKMKKQKVWYRSKDHPNTKEIKKEADESTASLEDIDEEEMDFSDEDPVNSQLLQLESAQQK